MASKLPTTPRPTESGPPATPTGAARGLMRRHPWLLGLVGILALLGASAYAIAFLIDEPLRRHIEGNINARLKGYTARIGRADLHPLGFSLDLEDSIIVQDAHPDPPVARIPSFSASVQWRALLFGRLVANVVIERPALHVNLGQAKQEIADKVSMKERGWQAALEATYPLKINEFKVVDADITYIDQGPFKPLRLRHVNLRTGNIRNIRSPERTYPSDIRVEGVVFDRGRLFAEGHADFLAEPHPGALVDVSLEQVELDYFKPIINRYNVWVSKGTLSAAGRAEYAPHVKTAELEHVLIDGIQVDYVHRPETAPVEKQTAEQVARAAQEVSNKPGILLRIGQLRIVNGTFGFINRAAKPDYRLFLTDSDVTLTNLSNQRVEGAATARVHGKFMGSGSTAASATFRPEQRGPDFDLAVRVENTRMDAMNDLFRAYGNFDVVGGSFSFYSDLSVKNGSINGYVKPLFKDMDVYDERQDRDKSLFRKAYEGLIGGVAKLLENFPRDEVATRATVSGTVDQPRISTWEVVMRLAQNAFFKAILPGFERDARRAPPARAERRGPERQGQPAPPPMRPMEEN
jgi:hypothetical protein